MTQGDPAFLYSDAAVDRCGQKDGPKHLEPQAVQFDYFQATVLDGTPAKPSKRRAR